MAIKLCLVKTVELAKDVDLSDVEQMATLLKAWKAFMLHDPYSFIDGSVLVVAPELADIVKEIVDTYGGRVEDAVHLARSLREQFGCIEFVDGKGGA